MMEKPKDRLKKARAVAGYTTPSDAARRIPSINLNSIISHENGHRPISRKAAEKYAALFKVSAGWILFGANDSVESIGEQKVPLKGIVGAGQALQMLGSDDIEFVESPPGVKPGTVAVEVRGDSMYPAYEDGTLLYYSINQPPETMVNKRCIVKLIDERTFVKILRRGSSSALWTLQSINTQYSDMVDVSVLWVSPIEWVKPKI